SARRDRSTRAGEHGARARIARSRVRRAHDGRSRRSVGRRRRARRAHGRAHQELLAEAARRDAGRRLRGRARRRGDGRDGRTARWADVCGKNVEVVPALQRKMRDARCSWERSIDVLQWAKAEGAAVTKSSLMVGCGETESDVHEAMAHLREANVDVLTIGQYL